MATRLLIALALTLAVLPARAETYKWIDSKGQVNYSNAPPPSAMQLIQLVEERISVVGEDPSTRDAVARMEARLAQRRQFEAQDWLQRQRAMVMQGGDIYASSDYGMPYYPAYYSPYSYGGRVFNTIVPRPVHLSHSRSSSRSHSRGFARR